MLRIAASPAPGRGGSAPGTWLPIDRLVISSVTWGDGLVEGDPQPAASEKLLDAGTALQLERAVLVLRAAAADAAAHLAPALRADIAGLTVNVTTDEAERARRGLDKPDLIPLPQARSTMQNGMQNVKNAITNDVDEWVSKGGSAEAYASWLGGMAQKYEGWARRISR